MRTPSTVLLLLTTWTAAAASPLRGQDPQVAEAEVQAVIQAQADAFNRGDLDATMATLAQNVDWRTIQRTLIDGHDAVRSAMRGWIDLMHGNNVRLVYPPEELSVQLLTSDHAVADVVLLWEDATSGSGPKRQTAEESLFFVFERKADGWRIVHVRNTTTCLASPND